MKVSDSLFIVICYIFLAALQSFIARFIIVDRLIFGYRDRLIDRLIVGFTDLLIDSQID